MLDPRLVRTQPNGWTCGPAALRHACLCSAVQVSIARICELSGGTRKTAPGDTGLASAAATLGFRLDHELHTTWQAVKTSIRAHIDAREPILLCVDRDSTGPYAHWILVHRANSRGVWICDSARNDPLPRRPTAKGVIRWLTWGEFLSRSVVWRPPRETKFHLYPLRKM